MTSGWSAGRAHPLRTLGGLAALVLLASAVLSCAFREEPPPPAPPPPPPRVGAKPGGEGVVLYHWNLDAHRVEVFEPGLVSWNAWAEQDPYEPVAVLRPNTHYTLVLDLSLTAYDRRRGAVGHRFVGAGLRPILDDWIRDRSRKTAHLTAVILPDPGVFRRPDQRAQRLDIDVEKLRAAVDAGLPARPRDLFAAMQEGHRDFVLGHVAFPVMTRHRAGPATVAVSLWDDQNRPVEELRARLCIGGHGAAECEGGTTLESGGLDALRPAAEGGTTADVGLHFVRLTDRLLVGVLRRRDWPPDQYASWPLDGSYDDLAAVLRKTTLDAFRPGTTAEARLGAGRGLYNRLFPRHSAPGARQELEAALTPFFGREVAADALPTLFVRMPQEDEEDVFVLPVGLLVLPAPSGDDFVGFHARIESPLPVQSWARSPECVSRWVMAIPADGDGTPEELRKARARIAGRLAAYEPVVRLAPTMPVFRAWLRDPAADARTALFVLSHHAPDRLYFSEGDAVIPDEIERSFVPPAVAVLNGCGTGGPGASGFVHKLNDQGMSTVIATSTEVHPEMAGDFLECLAREVEAHRDDPDFDVWHAYFGAVDCTRKSVPPSRVSPWGSSALAYALMGNSRLRLCPPAGGPP